MSKKSKVRREDRLVHGDEVLASRGVVLDAPDEELLPRLISQIGADPDADLAIADQLGSIPLPEAAEHLASWEKRDGVDKHLRRIIRQSLFRLVQRGVEGAIRAAPDPGPARAPLTTPIAEAPRGYLSPLDGAGNRLAWLTMPRVEGGVFILRCVIDDGDGMHQIAIGHMNRTQFRDEMERTERLGATMVEAPHRYVDWLMYDAHARGAPRDGGVSYPLMRGEIYDAPPDPVPSPAAGMLQDFPAGRIEELLDQSADLFKQREFQGWVIPDEDARIHLDRFREAGESTLVLDRNQVSDRLTGIISAAFDDLFAVEGGRTRGLYAARMREMALWFALADRAPAAHTCWAVHLALEEAGRKLDKVPFLRALVFRAFLHLMPRASAGDPATTEAKGGTGGAGGTGPDPGDLIVRPE